MLHEYAELGVVAGLLLLSLYASFDAHQARRRADAAGVLARRAHLRLDRMNKTSPVSIKETVIVPYEKGWTPEDTWEDDFSQTRVSPLARIKKWFHE